MNLALVSRWDAPTNFSAFEVSSKKSRCDDADFKRVPHTSGVIAMIQKCTKPGAATITAITQTVVLFIPISMSKICILLYRMLTTERIG